MKNFMAKISSFFIYGIFLTVMSVQAQSIESFQAQIPFDFQIGNKAFQAGDYIISLKSPFTQEARLMVTNAKIRDWWQIAVLTNGKRSLTGKTFLTFNRYGDQYILTQMVSTDFGFFAPKSRVKKHIAKKAGQPNETVTIVLLKNEV